MLAIESECWLAIIIGGVDSLTSRVIYEYQVKHEPQNVMTLLRVGRKFTDAKQASFSCRERI